MSANLEMTSDNSRWAEKVIKKLDPDFRHRWDVYNEVLFRLLNNKIIWIDCGCGNNEKVLVYGKMTKMAYGIDLIKPNYKGNNFINADIKHLPIKTGGVDLITLRFVVEHFENPGEYFSEYARVLNHKGKVLIITTNRFSPIILLPQILLPYKIKSKIITKVFKVKEVDIFKTFHYMNSIKKIKTIKNFKIVDSIYLSDLNLTRLWMFALLFFWHLITAPKFLNKFRSNILTVLEKTVL